MSGMMGDSTSRIKAPKGMICHIGDLECLLMLWCSFCRTQGHSRAICWKEHPELAPTESNLQERHAAGYPKLVRFSLPCAPEHVQILRKHLYRVSLTGPVALAPNPRKHASGVNATNIMTDDHGRIDAGLCSGDKEIDFRSDGESVEPNSRRLQQTSDESVSSRPIARRRNNAHYNGNHSPTSLPDRQDLGHTTKKHTTSTLQSPYFRDRRAHVRDHRNKHDSRPSKIHGRTYSKPGHQSHPRHAQRQLPRRSSLSQDARHEWYLEDPTLHPWSPEIARSVRASRAEMLMARPGTQDCAESAALQNYASMKAALEQSVREENASAAGNVQPQPIASAKAQPNKQIPDADFYGPLVDLGQSVPDDSAELL